MREKVWKNVNLPVQSLIQLYLHTVQRHEKHENNLGKLWGTAVAAVMAGCVIPAIL